MQKKRSHEDIQKAQDRNDRNVLKAWLYKQRIPAWDPVNDTLLVSIWDHYWRQHSTFADTDRIKTNQWSSLLALPPRIRRIAEFQTWFEYAIQTQVPCVFNDESIVQSILWWGDEWASRYYETASVPNALNDFTRIQKKSHNVIQTYWNTRYFGEKLGHKLGQCIKTFEMICIKNDAHAWRTLASALDQQIKISIANTNVEQQYALFQTLDQYMKKDPVAWKNYFLQLTHVEDYAHLYWTAKPLPVIPQDFQEQWEYLLDETKNENPPQKVWGYKHSREWSTPYDAYIERSYLRAIDSAHLPPLELLQKATSYEKYTSSWIDRTLDIIEQTLVHKNHMELLYKHWGQWLYTQRHTLHEWSDEQRKRAKQISATIPETVTHYWDAHHDKETTAFREIIRLLLPLEHIVHYWKYSNDYTSYLGHLYEHFYATPPDRWNKRVIQDFLLQCMDDTRTWTDEERVLIDNLITAFSSDSAIIESITMMLHPHTYPLCQPLDLP